MVVICRYGEIFLKGLNKGKFEHALVQAIKKKVPHKINMLRNRIIVETDNSTQLQTVCGLTSVSKATKTMIDKDAIISAALQSLPKTFSSFKVDTRRLTKTDLFDSPQLNEIVGSAIWEKTQAKIQMKDPELTIGIEIIDKHAYVFKEKRPCPGGLPEGVSGSVLVPSDDPHAELAALLMLKRGCSVSFDKEKNFKIFSKFTSPSKIKPIAVARGTLNVEHMFNNLPEFYPLIGMNEEEAQISLQRFASLAGGSNGGREALAERD